jgi:hypothetical protein
MKKYIKFCASLVIIILSIMLGSVVFAEENGNSKGGTTIQEERKLQLQTIIQTIKDKRDKFKTEIETSREQTQLKIIELRASFQESLGKIKDEGKKTSAKKIVSTIQSLNTKLTDHYTNKVDQIENVLVSVESRVTKAKDAGLDVSTVLSQIEKAKTAIATAREAISIQASKVYIVNVTDDSTLKAQMKSLRDGYITDMKAVKAKVKLAHSAVMDTATTLAKIPKIDDVDTTTPVENSDDATTNNN